MARARPNTDDALACHRCGKRHIGAFRYLELSIHTGQWSDPDHTQVPPEESQGLFRFGLACARRVLSLGRTAK